MIKAAFFILSLTALQVLGQIPSGHFAYSFTNLALWDFSGEYQQTESGDALTLQLSHAANGKISGTRTEVYDDSSSHIDLSGAIWGRVFSNAEGVGVTAKEKGSCSGTYEGTYFEGKVSAQHKAMLVPAQSSLQGQSTIHISILGHGATTRDSFVYTLTNGMTGEWQLDLGVTAENNKLSGSATVTLSNGRSLSYTVKGQYNARRQVSTLRLSGSGEAYGTSLLLTGQGPELTLVKLNGRVLGQKLKLP